MPPCPTAAVTSSGVFVLANRVFDFRAVRAHIGPGVDKVFGAQCRIGAQKLIFADPQAARLFQRPDWNAGANDARFATADSWGRVYSGKRIIQVLHDETQRVCLLGATEAWKQFLNLAQVTHTRFQFT